MNYYDARQRATDKKWDYTCMNDDRVRPVGYCADAGGGHHDTEEEARKCYTAYILDKRLRLDGNDSGAQRKCRVCGEWTSRFAEMPTEVFILCDAHCTREQVEKLFGTVGSITSSY